MAIFVDTGAWFAYFVRRDPDHPAAVEWMRQNRQPLVTTDFVFDELVTLLALRESRRVAVAAGDLLWTQQVADLEEVAQGDLAEAWDVFRRYEAYQDKIAGAAFIELVGRHRNAPRHPQERRRHGLSNAEA